jgi:hypothetical protein
MSLILSTPTNPGTASWTEGAGAALAQKVVSMAADATITPTDSTSYYATTSGSQVDITVSAPTFPGQVVSVFFATDGGQNVVLTFPAALNAAGNTIVTLNDAGDSLVVLALATGASSLRWVLLLNNGGALS